MDRQQQELGTHILALAPPAAATAAPATLVLQLGGIGVLSPAFASWTEAVGVLSGLAAYRDHGLPPLERLRLPANEARRISISARIALEVAEEALADAAIPARSIAGIFACSGGNSDSLSKVLASLAESVVSPTQFAQMGHHAAAGVWSLVNGSPAPTSSIGSFDGSFAAGLLEAGCQALAERRPVLLVAHDVPPPAAFRSARPVSSACAVALVLAEASESASASMQRGRLHLSLTRQREETRLFDPALEQLRLNNPAARALPLLRLIAAGVSGRVVLPYLERLRLAIRYTPC